MGALEEHPVEDEKEEMDEEKEEVDDDDDEEEEDDDDARVLLRPRKRLISCVTPKQITSNCGLLRFPSNLIQFVIMV